jgi:hypothetical protein
VFYLAVGGEAPTVKVGQESSFQITATNNPTSYDAFPTPPETTLPPGLKFDLVPTLGIIYGVPTKPDKDHRDTGYAVTLKATNASGTGSKDVNFFITATPTPAPSPSPIIISSTCATARAGQPFTFQVLPDKMPVQQRN